MPHRPTVIAIIEQFLSNFLCSAQSFAASFNLADKVKHALIPWGLESLNSAIQMSDKHVNSVAPKKQLQEFHIEVLAVETAWKS